MSSFYTAEAAGRRRNTLRRGMAGLLAAGMAVTLGAFGVNFPSDSAQAYTVETVPGPAIDKNPVAKATMEHTFAEGVTPAPGATFTYNGKVEFTGVSGTNLENIYTIYVTQGEKAPFTPAPTKSSLTFTDQNGSPVQPQSLEIEKVNDNTWKYVAKGMSGDITAKFSNEAQISADATSGDFASASISGEVLSKPVLDMQKSDGMLVSALDGSTSDGVSTPSRGCRGYVTNTWTSKPGAWLLDIKLADNAGKGKVKFDDAPFSNGAQQPANWQDPSTFNSLKVTDASGKDITADILAGSSYVNPDPSKPQYVIDPLIAKTGNAQWIDSTNWVWDPSTWTGRTWLPAGATVVATHGYTFENCVDPGLSTDGDTNRNIAFALEIARPEVTANANDNDLIILPSKPGEAPKPDKAWCEDIFIQKGNGTTFSDVVAVNPEVTPLAVRDIRDSLNPKPYAGAIALSPITKDKIYYLNNKKVFVAPTTPGSTGVDAGFPPVNVIDNVGAGIGIDPNGVIWVMISGGTLFSLDPNAESPQWISHGTPINPDAPGNYFYDLTFAQDGTLLLVANNLSGSKKSYSKGVYFFNKESIDKVRPETETFTPNKTEVFSAKTTAERISYVNGFAVDREGNLYVGGGFDNSLFLLKDGVMTKVLNSRFTDGIADMGSCSFYPADTPPEVNNDPKFQVQKSAIDPVTGAVAKAGATTENSAVIAADGSTTIQYLVTVANTGGGAGDPGDVTDTIAPPKGFTIMDVLVDGKSVSANNVLTLRPGNLEANSYKSYKITVKLQADSLEAGNNAVGECRNEGPGQAGGGFFNSVTMNNDSDGADNNDACVPVKPRPKAHLKLVKQIVNQDGSLSDDQSAAKKFGLSAGSGDPSSMLTSVNGVTGSEGVDKDVIAGTYVLNEQPLADQPENEYFALGDWKCDSGKTVENGRVQLNENDNVTCTVKNTRMPLTHIQKFPADPTDDNVHVGKLQTPELIPGSNPAQYRTEVSYLIKVTNTSTFTANTAQIRDYFKVPAGMKWDGDKPAKVEFVPGTTGAKAADLATTLTKAELENTSKGDGARLASAVTNLPAKGEVSFKVTIPLLLDTTPDPQTGLSAYDQNAAKLAECYSGEREGEKFTTTASGIANRTSLENEDLRYNQIPILDNYACIPVKIDGSWKVQKFAPAEGGGYVPNAGTTGPAVRVTTNGDAFEATVNYKVRVTNNGPTASLSPVVTDSVTLPEGFNVTALRWQVEGADRFNDVPQPGNQNVANFELPASTKPVPATTDTAQEPAFKNYIDYIVQVTGRTNGQNITAEQWEKAGTCETENAGNASAGGFFNQVTIPNEQDPNADNDNDACVPVVSSGVPVRIIKTDSSGNTALPGAKFALYDVDPTQSDALPIEEVINGLSEEAAYGNVGNEFTNPGIVDALGEASKTETVFETKPLQIGKTYWLVETQAPFTSKAGVETRYNLLAQPLKFRVNAGGIIEPYDNGSGQPVVSDEAECDPTRDNGCDWQTSPKIVDGGTFYVFKGVVNVRDTRTAELPKAGGNGRGPLIAMAVLIILVSLGLTYKTSAVATRYVSTGKPRDSRKA
ncbi:hypothetical protein BK816_08880 [Boudabousia tangfeifanii]|uniref:Uncharacterized protein n=1 Tax=Boudabousia tangfeifanii TaxID=1912795 RepID=A0A1D9MLX1_9ACTO|nr:SpaA isopeptide-forming pilin-related protein [Boudabousia tangfeifanii]AOZ73371.1 hypothetical protein BK816_08880 [Boudabousia tangfeifanii]